MLWGGGGCVWPAQRWKDLEARGADVEKMLWACWADLLPLLVEPPTDC